MAPVRTVGSRLLSFADRLVSNWVGPTSVNPVAGPGATALTLGAAQRVAPMQVARPWYETPGEVAARQVVVAPPRPPRVEAVAVESVDSPVTPAASTVQVVAPLPVSEEARPASRGASIERTQVVAPPVERPAAREVVPAPVGRSAPPTVEPTAALIAPVAVVVPAVTPPAEVAPIVSGTTPPAVPSTSTAAEAPVVTSRAPDPIVTAPTAGDAAVISTAEEPKVPSTIPPAVVAARPIEAAAPSSELRAPVPAPTEMKAREWLQLAPLPQPPIAAPAPLVVQRPTPARSLTERLLQHARWADDQLRVSSTRAVEAPQLSAGSASYVFVAPAVPEAPPQSAAQRAARTAVEIVVERPAVASEPVAAPLPKVEAAPTAPQSENVVPAQTATTAPVAGRSVEAPVVAVEPQAAVPTAPIERPAVASVEANRPVVAEAHRAVAEANRQAQEPNRPADANWPGLPAFARAQAASLGLPDLRLAAGLPSWSTGADRVASFIDQLVGVQAGRDAQSPALLPAASGGSPSLEATAERAPGIEYLRLPDGARPVEGGERAPIGSAASSVVVDAARVEASRAVDAAIVVPELAAPTVSTDATRVSRLPEAAPMARAEAAIAADVPSASVSTPATTGTPSVEDRATAPAASTAPIRQDATRALRPGGIAARAEQLGTLVDGRVMAAWGATTTTTSTLPDQLPVLQPARSAPPLSYVTPAGAPPNVTTASSGPSRNVEFVERLGSSELVRQTAPLSLAAALSQRPQVTIEEAPRERAVGRPVVPATQSTSKASPSTIAAGVPPMPVIQTVSPSTQSQTATSLSAAPPARAQQTTASFAPQAVATTTSAPPQSHPAPSMATSATSAAARGQVVVRVPLRLASAGLRAEQLAGIIGVRAADLSLDFVDPSTLPALTGNQWSPDMAYVRTVAVGGEPAGGSTFAPAGSLPRVSSTASVTSASGEAGPAPRSETSEAVATPLIARMAVGARLSPEEWALVAAFPSASTVMQLATSRRSAQFLQTDSQRAAAAPERALLTATPSTFSRGGVGTASIGRFAGGFVSTTGAEIGPSSSGALSGSEETAPGATLSFAERGGAPAEYVAPSSPQRSMLPNIRQPRGGFIWPRAAGFSTTTASAVEQASHAADRAQSADHAAPGSPLWESLRPAMVNVQGSEKAAGSSASSTLSDIEMARPFLEMVNGSVSADESRTGGVRFFEQPAPIVSAAAPSTEAATMMVEAVRRAPSHAPSDDRVTLGDLTLISVASATGQLAASEAGGRPQASAPSGGESGGGKGGGGKGGGKGGHAPNIEDLARRVFDELQRVIEIQRERSGNSWER